MNRESLQRILTGLLSIKIGLAVAPDSTIPREPGWKEALNAGVVLREERAVPCTRHDVVKCSIETVNGRMYAYHANPTCRFEIAEGDTYQYIIDYKSLFGWVCEELIGCKCERSQVGLDSYLVWALTRYKDLEFNLILAPRAKDGTIGRLYDLVSNLKQNGPSLVVTHDPMTEAQKYNVQRLSSGFANLVSVMDVGNSGYMHGLLIRCTFQAEILRKVMSIRGLALRQMDFGLDMGMDSDSQKISADLMSSYHSQDWARFEKLCRYAISFLLPSALEGYGATDSGKLPDSVGVLPDDKGKPSRFVMFDAKALESFAKDKFLFRGQDPSKYVDYVETAEKVSSHLKFDEVTLVFVAPDFSMPNILDFSRKVVLETRRRRISIPTGIIFLRLGSLVVLLLAQTDPSHAAVIRSKHPDGSYERLLFSPADIIRLLSDQKLLDGERGTLATQDAVVLDEATVETILSSLYQGDSHYAEFFKRFRQIAQTK